MPLKKKLFRSNMLFLFLSLLTLLLIGTAVIGAFEETIEQKFEEIGNERIDGDAWELSKDIGKEAIRESFGILVLVVLVVGITAILALLLLATIFTRWMSNLVTKPLDSLVEGAKRIQDGNLEEEIIYEGQEEFERVCQAFNEMQKTILSDQEQRIRNENARIDMVTGISHDLRTPLTSIRGYIKGVLDGVADTEEKRTMYLETAYDSTVEMNILLQKLFDFSRMESGQMPFHMVRIDLAEYVKGFVAQKEKTSKPSEVQFVMEQEEEILPEADVDIEQIRRILDNLLENSIKYVKKHPVEVWIRVIKEETYLTLEWKDNGEGVPEEKIGKIFDRFYRCDEARTKKGSGVGLYVVKYIMEQHGGSVEAVNDRGLKITLRFPRADKK